VSERVAYKKVSSNKATEKTGGLASRDLLLERVLLPAEEAVKGQSSLCMQWCNAPSIVKTGIKTYEIVHGNAILIRINTIFNHIFSTVDFAREDVIHHNIMFERKVICSHRT